jgi:hypothetical protein
MRADQLAKDLYYYLVAADCHSSDLRRLGWFEFIRYDLPDTDDPRVLAAVALHRLLVDDSGTQIHHDDRVVYGILTYVHSRRRGRLPSTVSRDLMRLLSRPPVAEAALVDWFLAAFP